MGSGSLLNLGITPNGRFPNGIRGDLITLMLRFLFVAEFMVERVDLRCGASTLVLSFV